MTRDGIADWTIDKRLLLFECLEDSKTRSCGVQRCEQNMHFSPTCINHLKPNGPQHPRKKTVWTTSVFFSLFAFIKTSFVKCHIHMHYYSIIKTRQNTNIIIKFPNLHQWLKADKTPVAPTRVQTRLFEFARPHRVDSGRACKSLSKLMLIGFDWVHDFFFLIADGIINNSLFHVYMISYSLLVFVLIGFL